MVKMLGCSFSFIKIETRLVEEGSNGIRVKGCGEGGESESAMK